MVRRGPIRRTDRVADVLARDEALVEVFAAASPAFERLRDPKKRRIVARLTTVEQAARIARVDPDRLVARLNRAHEAAADAGCGTRAASIPELTREEDIVPDTDRTAAPAAMPAALERIPESAVVDLDVREALRSGEEPFRTIMAAKREVPAGGALRLRAIFEPAPLYAVMAKQGFAHWTERLADDDWRVWFYPEPKADTEARPASDAGPDGTAGREASVRGGDAESGADRGHEEADGAAGSAAGPDDEDGDDDVVVLDVRSMEPPEPMVATLAALEDLPADKTLVQINVRVPRFLLPRLEERGWSWEVREQEGGPVRVFIRRADG